MTLGNINIDDKQKERLNFLLDTFYPNWNEENSKVNLKKSIDELMNEALHDLYKKTRDQINQGNEHDGLPLIKEI